MENPSTSQQIHESTKLDFKELRCSTDEFNFLRRDAASYFDKFDENSLTNLLANYNADWIFSQEENRSCMGGTHQKSSLSRISQIEKPDIVILFPCNKDIRFEIKEMHQILRELVVGLYGLNQTPSLTLQMNEDQSMNCVLSPAYQDTRVGQLMIDVDYHMKSLWSDCYFPEKKLKKFTERWRHAVAFNHITGAPTTKRSLQLIWSEAGQIELSKTPEFENEYKDLYESIEKKVPFHHSQSSNLPGKLGISMTFSQKKLLNKNHVFIADSVYDVNCSSISLHHGPPDDTLLSFLKLHQSFIARNLKNMNTIVEKIEQLKMVNFLIILLVSLKKKHKLIPDLNDLQPPINVAECLTNREFPPVAVSDDREHPLFSSLDSYRHLVGGIHFDRYGTENIENFTDEFDSKYNDMLMAWRLLQDRQLRYVPSNNSRNSELPRITVGDSDFVVFGFKIIDFFPFQPQIPRWVDVYSQMITNYLPQKLPLNNNQIQDRLIKSFGYQKAVKLKSPQTILLHSASAGLLDIIVTLSRRHVSNIPLLQDQHGYSLLHHAAAMNHASVITYLVAGGCNVNNRKLDTLSTLGVTPLHLAAKCGAIESLSCLIALGADVGLYDKNGFAAIHYAAAYNENDCVRIILQKCYSNNIEMMTNNDLKMTPLLIAARYGSLNTISCLLKFNVNIFAKDINNLSFLHLATLHCHSDILEYFIEEDQYYVNVWEVLTDMLSSDHVSEYNNSAAVCLEILILKQPEHYSDLLASHSIPCLVHLLCTGDDKLKATISSVLSCISQYPDVRTAISNEKPIKSFVGILCDSQWDTLLSRVCVILADLACDDNAQNELAIEGCIEIVVNQLSSEPDHLLVNSVNLLRVTAEGNNKNQTIIGECDVIFKHLNRLLNHASIQVQANTAACICTIASKHSSNQESFIEAHSVELLAVLLKSKSSECQMNAAEALQVLSNGNPSVQEIVDEKKATSTLLRMLKMWDVKTREQGASTLWSLAGETWERQRYIASLIGILQITDMLMTKSLILNKIGCQALSALARDNIKNQLDFVTNGVVVVLVTLLKQSNASASNEILLLVIQSLGFLCIDLAHQPNKQTQTKASDANAISILIRILTQGKAEHVQVEIVKTLANLSLRNRHCQEVLRHDRNFTFEPILKILHSEDVSNISKLSEGLSTLAYKKKSIIKDIIQHGGIPWTFFDGIFTKGNELSKVMAAFDAIILMDATDVLDKVQRTGECIEFLVSRLQSTNDDVVSKAASRVASLANIRDGVPDAMLEAGVIQHLVSAIDTTNEWLATNVSVAIGFLSFHAVAMRQLLAACRSDYSFYSKIMKYLRTGKISLQFVKEWEHQLVIGIPKLSLSRFDGSINPSSSRCLGNSNQDKRQRAVTALDRFNHAQGSGLPRLSANTRITRARSAPFLLPK